MTEIKMLGFVTCPSWLKLKYREAVKFKCQGCHKDEIIVGILQPHRIKQGHKGGLYTIVPLKHEDNNIKVLCKKCHKLIHANNYSHVRSK